MLEHEPDKIPDTADLLLQLREQLDAARSMPLSASVMLNREEFGQILQDAIDGLPEELRQAAEDTVDQAGRLAAKMRLEAEDYVDRKLAGFEVVLDRTMQQVAKGRERLSIHAPAT